MNAGKSDGRDLVEAMVEERERWTEEVQQVYIQQIDEMKKTLQWEREYFTQVIKEKDAVIHRIQLQQTQPIKQKGSDRQTVKALLVDKFYNYTTFTFDLVGLYNYYYVVWHDALLKEAEEERKREEHWAPVMEVKGSDGVGLLSEVLAMDTRVDISVSARLPDSLYNRNLLFFIQYVLLPLPHITVIGDDMKFVLYSYWDSQWRQRKKEEGKEEDNGEMETLLTTMRKLGERVERPLLHVTPYFLNRIQQYSEEKRLKRYCSLTQPSAVYYRTSSIEKCAELQYTRKDKEIETENELIAFLTFAFFIFPQLTQLSLARTSITQIRLELRDTPSGGPQDREPLPLPSNWKERITVLSIEDCEAVEGTMDDFLSYPNLLRIVYTGRTNHKFESNVKHALTFRGITVENTSL